MHPNRVSEKGNCKYGFFKEGAISHQNQDGKLLFLLQKRHILNNKIVVNQMIVCYYFYCSNVYKFLYNYTMLYSCR